MSARLFFSVGEPSGDVHAGNLIRALRSLDSSISIRGFGGVQMAAAGTLCDFDLTSLAVVGFAEVLPKLREFFRVADMAEDIFRRGECDGVVLVDFPGFNWHIAKRAKKYGLPVYYYLPPQLWAWGQWRIRKVRKYVDRVLCNLPFEEEWYAKRDVQADYVGHPFFDVVASQPLSKRFIDQWTDRNTVQIAVLPGSRDREVDTIWPMQLQIIRDLHAKFPHARFLVAALKDQHALKCRAAMTANDRSLPIDVFVGKTSEILSLVDCALIKSGSVSMEAMARGTPCVVLYHVSASTYVAAKVLTKLKSITLPNLIAGHTIIPEFLAVGRSRRKAIACVTESISRLISDPSARESQRSALRSMANQYAKPGASLKTAKLIYQDLQTRLNPRDVLTADRAA